MKNNGQIISKLFRKSVVSIILAAIATMLGIVIDGIVIGRFLGKDSMAAYGLVTPVINLANHLCPAAGRRQKRKGAAGVFDVHDHHRLRGSTDDGGRADFQG